MLTSAFLIKFTLQLLFKVVRNKKIENFFSSLFDRDKSNEPCPAFVRYRYPIEITPPIFYFSYFSRETAVQESLMAPFFAKNAQTTLCLKGCNICLQEDRGVKVGLMSP